MDEDDVQREFNHLRGRIVALELLVQGFLAITADDHGADLDVDPVSDETWADAVEALDRLFRSAEQRLAQLDRGSPPAGSGRR